MGFIKNIWNKIKKPNAIFLVLFCMFFVSITSATLVLVVLEPVQTILHYILYILSAISLTYFIYIVVIFAPKIRQGSISFLRKFKITNEMLDNYGYRTLMFAIFSFILNIAYVIFIGVLAIKTHSAWYISITAYYLILSIMKGNIFYSKKKYNTDIKRARAYRYCGIMFILLTFAFSGIIVLIYTSSMYFEYAGIIIYAVAAFTFYKLVLGIVNIFKARYQDDLYIQSIRNVNLVSALISLVVLQVALFQEFSPHNNTSFANGLVGGLVSIIILALGIFMIVKANRKIREIQKLNNVLEKEEGDEG